MTPHSQKVNEVLSAFATDETKGLTSAQVAENVEKYGPNKLEEKKKKGIVARFMEQFKDVMIIILLIAAAISLGVAIYDGISKNHFDPVEMVEPFLILAI